MELLSPAGSYDQAIKAIKAGCDALYGGIWKWNARLRAQNFTVEEYRDILRVCRSHGVCFYLTINTLMGDEEITDIIEFLKEPSLIPDGVIVTDIGLIQAIKTNLPNLPIHVSTQQGVSNTDEAVFFERLGVQRIILSRELRLNEIKEIRENTSLGLEVFCYGAQCVGYSGYCYWGALIDGQSGNFGSCSGECRMVYQCDQTVGQPFFMDYMDNIEYVNVLEEIGINSIKIEGRMRTADEIYLTTKRFKNALLKKSVDRSKYSAGCISYLASNKNRFVQLNCERRVKLPYGKHDLIYDDIDGYHWGNAENVCCEYLFTNFVNDNQPFNRKNLISAYLLVEGNNYILKLNGKIFENSSLRIQIPSGSEILNPGSLFSIIISVFGNNIKNLNSYCSENFIINCDRDALYEELVKVSGNLSFNTEDTNLDDINQITDRTKFFETNNSSVVELLLDKGIVNIVYDIDDIDDLSKVLHLNKSIILKLPILDWENKMYSLKELLVGQRVMLSKISQLVIAEKLGVNVNQVCFDYTANITNSWTLEFLLSKGIKFFTCSIEVPLSYRMKALAEENQASFMFMEGGILPLAFSRYEFSKNADSLSYKNINGHYSVRCINNKTFGYWSILPTKGFAFSTPDGVRKRYSLYGLTYKEVAELFR